MRTQLDELKTHALADIANAQDTAALRDVEVACLGRKGKLTGVLRGISSLPAEQRPLAGKLANEVKKALEAAIEARRVTLKDREQQALLRDEEFDITAPGQKPLVGHLHPVTQVQYHVEDVFRSMGFYVLDYPEVETDYYNFEALNIPKDHPARDMQDTFWLTDGHLMRTHTSPGQIRAMEQFAPPFKAVFPGRCFRYETVDASHEHTFYQVEGLMIDEDISVAHLISSMKTLLTQIFERDMNVRLRPGYFPFVEPGFELDIRCLMCGGNGCSVCKRSGWVELMPCGLVHPNVLRFGKLDPAKWSGWAFGLGLSRMAMMKFGIDDIRLFLGGDLRFLTQF
ncbi:MAG: phenylalanine--tRNA ligase subunit alpha [Planctomycetes bacterium]|nr:phenylalanine--tRNA ligase subunit alpha [Planctomycetota bacterium]